MRAGGTPQRGVTRIELAVAAVLVAALVAIGLPNYRRYVTRVNGVDAVQELRTLAQRLERCRQREGSYTQRNGMSEVCVVLPYTIPEGTYRISGHITADAFLLTAEPQGSQAADTACAAFQLDQAGKQGITGSGTVQGCWAGQGS